MNTTILFFIVFGLFCLQMFLTYFQAKNYKTTLNSLKTEGIIGIGHTKGILKKGQIIILVYDPKKKVVTKCKSMKGRTIFARFKDSNEFLNFTLEDLKNLPELNKVKNSPKKSALLQAIIAIENRIISENNKIKVSV